MGSFSIGHWAIVALVILVVFGTKKLGSAGTDLGRAIRGFKDEVKKTSAPSEESSPSMSNVKSGQPDHPDKSKHG